MTLIEGIGDEVVHFFILLVTVLITLFAWWSTNISERPLMRTVLILERRATRHTASESETTVGDLSDTMEATPEQINSEAEPKTSPSDNDSSNQIEVNLVQHIDNIFVNREDTHSTMGNFEVEGLESGNSSDESVVKNRRIAFFKNKDEHLKVQNQNKCLKNLIDGSSTSGEFEAHSSDEGNIRIRLKYLNDDQKLVEGKLQEQLGDFKRRHFSLELSGRKLVRLIFNGKVLQQDTKTLQNYGFFDNCVVHCLVHQPRTPPPSPNLNRSRNEGSMQNETAHHWDLGNILFASLSFFLGLAWYVRYQYGQLYTATTTVALIGVTGMFTVSLIGMYMPDADGLRTQ